MKHAGGALIPSLTIDRSDKATLSTQLVTGLRRMILTGDLAVGTRLPATRILARDQGVSRTTIVTVYDQLLAEGLIVSRVGAGTFVSEEVSLAPAPPPLTGNDPLPRLASLSRGASEQYFPRLSHPGSPRAFVTGMPAFDAFPMSTWARISSQYWRSARAAIMSYPDPAGLPELRRAICQHLRANRGLVCETEEVFVFAGAQDAFSQIAEMILDPGEPVWMENPGAIGARNAFYSRGARLVPVPVDEDGIDVSQGLALEPAPRAIFVTPAHQHPLGVTMSRDRRFELLAAAGAAGAWIVEDDYVGEFNYAKSPLPPLKALDGGGRVIYVGTFSKALFPAVRLGYAVMPPSLVDIFERALGATAHGVSSAMQSIVTRFIEEGHFSAHIRRMRETYAERRDTLIEASARHLSGRIDVRPTETGFHTVGFLPEGGLGEAELERRAEGAGLATASLGRFALAPLTRKGVTLGFSAVPPAELARGVERLAALLGSVSSPPGSTPPPARRSSGRAHPDCPPGSSA
ncbi:PLP-dependent aminotransferase family protein [Roseicyclus sp. F158]|uniref:PLP-dependent aminotransferase family protein n=1 Tax=Tropicimonas omnivorans TaxID=3075590 RepID=A0ABU3DGY0_9RHOB|nr:PLP-dependent aminotransferase family protein [Roseicyclus sp. F158]MDT0682959.1 PLP-dependent aminotransferase family protein [Roseicyclus sp. F158]